MKKTLLSTLLFLSAALPTAAQTMLIHQGAVTTAVNAGQLHGEFADGTTLNVLGKAFNVSEIDSIDFSPTAVTDNTIHIIYKGATASVRVAASCARYVTASVEGARVSIVQSADLPQELTYTLEGASDNGRFYMDGELKATVVLNNVQLSSATDDPFHIDNGKRISLVLTENTENSFVDAAAGAHKACFYVNGHTEIKGAGVLNITGRTNHAFFGDEYVELKRTAGTINVLSAVQDGLNINQYLWVKGGTITVKNVGDECINVSQTKTATDEKNGQIIIDAGVIDLKNTAGGKCMKSEKLLAINGGTVNVSATGGEGAEGIESKDTVLINGGYITSRCYDDAVNAANHIGIHGGYLLAVATNNDGIDSNGTIEVTGGVALSSGARSPEEGFDCDQNQFKVTGGILIGIGGATSTPTSSVCTQPVLIASSQNVTTSAYITLYDASATPLFTFLPPQALSGATVLVSAPGLNVGDTVQLNVSSSYNAPDDATAWQGFTASPAAASITGGTATSYTLSTMVTGGSSFGGGGRPGGGGWQRP